MPTVTREENWHRRRNAAANLAVGGAMMGGASAAQKQVARHTGVKNTFDAAKQIVRTGRAEARHGKFAAGWVGTRGLAAAGVPLVAIGTKNILTKKPKPVEAPDLKEDVIAETVRRTAHLPPKKKPLKEVSTQSGVSKMNSNDAAINTLAQREQKDLVRRKKKQSKYSLASAGLGATALGLQSPRLAALAVRRAPRLAKVKPLHSIANVAPKTTSMSNTVGVGSLGVGALGSLNFARINRSETKADERSSTALKTVSKMGEVDADKYLDSKKGRKHPYGAQRTLQDVDDYYRLVHGGRSKPERVAHHMESNLNPERAKAKQASVAREIGNRKTIERSLNMQNFIRTASGGKDPSDHDFAVADELGRRRKAGQPEAARIRSKTEIRNLKARQAAVHESRSTGKRLAPRQPDPHEEADQGFRDLGEHFYRKNPHPQLGNPYKNPSPHYKTQLDRVRTPAQKTQHNVDLAKALLPSLKTFKRPPRFAGVKTGGLRLIRNPLTGLQRQVTVRGSVG